jgi:hypothetical protein
MVTRPPATRTSQLEEKINGLVTLIKSATQSGPEIIKITPLNPPPESSVPSNHESAPASTASSSASYRDYIFDRLNTELQNSDFTPPVSSTSRSPPRASRYAFYPTFEPKPEEAEVYLNTFRTYFLDYLPFIVIPSAMKASQLRQERPMLWMCIMAVASNSITQQVALSKQVLETFGREAYVEGTRNMDFLLAVLVYAAW